MRADTPVSYVFELSIKYIPLFLSHKFNELCDLSNNKQPPHFPGPFDNSYNLVVFDFLISLTISKLNGYIARINTASGSSFVAAVIFIQ